MIQETSKRKISLSSKNYTLSMLTDRKKGLIIRNKERIINIKSNGIKKSTTRLTRCHYSPPCNPTQLQRMRKYFTSNGHKFLFNNT